MKQRLKKLIKLAIGASLVMYLVNKFIESDATIHHLLKILPGKYYRWKYGKIYYTKQGSGQPMLLIHDLHPSSSQQEWSAVIELLSKKYTVYAIDLPGCGRSDKPFLTYTNFLFAQLLRDFCTEVIGKKADVLVTGASCPLIISAAKLAPDSFGKLTLVNPDSPTNTHMLPDTKSKIIKGILDCPLIGVTLYYLLTCKSQLEYDFSEKYFYNPFHLTSKLIISYYESAHIFGGGGRHLQASIVGNYVNFDTRFLLQNLNNPIHLILGAELKNVRTIVSSYKKENGHITCTYIDKTKMLPQLEAPEKFLSCI